MIPEIQSLADDLIYGRKWPGIRIKPCNFITLLTSANRDGRRNAFLRYYAAYEAHKIHWRQAYLNFLILGGSKYPLEALKTADVDMRSPAPVRLACLNFSNLVDQLGAVIKNQ